MRNMIQAALGILGFLITFGAVGTLDYDPKANVAVQMALALVGLAMVYWATKDLEKA